MLVMQDINQAIAKAAISRARLIVVSAHTRYSDDIPSVFLNRRLSEQLLDTPRNDRARSVPVLMQGLTQSEERDVLLLDGLEILFDRSLAIDPIKMLADCAKSKTLIVRWPGDISSSGLSYAVPSHPEYRVYKASDIRDLIYLNVEILQNPGLQD